VITRRQILRGALACASGLGLYTWQVEPHWLEIVHRRLTIAGLPRTLAGLRLAFLSDLHIGPRVDDGYLLKTFARVRALAPDFVAYGGDFVSYEPEGLAHFERLLPYLPLGRLGTVGILGNHDYGRAWSQPERADALALRLAAAGITFLRNQSAEIAGLTIVGMDDLWAHRFDPARAFTGWEPARPTLVLSHNPDTVDLPGWERFAGTILAGHTHGGQCKPPFLPPPFLSVKNRRYTSGEFALAGGRRLYISRGVGHLLQVRFNVRPEVTVFELVGEADPTAKTSAAGSAAHPAREAAR
jgi:predicted MPP superfamily phosphohydrolase